MARLNEQQIERFHADGFLLVEQLFDDSSLRILSRELDRVAVHSVEYPDILVLRESLGEEMLRQLPGLESVRKINNLESVPEMLKLFGSGSLPARFAGQLIGDGNMRIMGMYCFAKPAGHGTETPWHQDQALWPHWFPTAVSCWVAIDACTVENGCLRFLPGSHKDGMAPPIRTNIPQQPLSIPWDRVDDARVVKLEMRAGDAVFFGGRVWHFSEPNRSGKRRLGMPAVYCADAEMQMAIHISDWVKMRDGFENGITWDYYDSRPQIKG